ncbi:MAG: cache domain-containing protein [Desulfatiglans sp.]|jgi:PAS domain S-box-containing protein|nr:cache domain-containing protein [Thermodesulfobacteriota bacterium]MEE4351248.1 cache domain-containing protein [Desulfatiglans sp.]
MNLFKALYNLPIRYKLILSYSSLFVLVITAISVVIYSLVKEVLEENIERELKNSTESILTLVKTSAIVSIRNHLSSLAHNNRDAVKYFYNQYRNGDMSEDQAKDMASTFLLHQTVGKTGYIYCVNSEGVAVVHPNQRVLGRNWSDRSFVKAQKTRKEGYLEYDWKNPGEPHERPKALYMTHFEPWDWIISISSYREEFNELVRVEDFSKSILAMRFGNTGYPYIIDTRGNIVIHPEKAKKGYYIEKNSAGRDIILEICKRKNGKITYDWENPETGITREKHVIYNHIPEYDWIVASTSYPDELFKTLNAIRGLIFVSVLLSVFVVIPITLRISSSMTNPLQELISRLISGSIGDFSIRMNRHSGDEIGQMALYFNRYMEKLESYHQHLRRSEEKFSKAFRSSPSPISITTYRNGKILDVNESFLRSTEYERHEVIGKSIQDLGFYFDNDEILRIVELLNRNGAIRNRPIHFQTKSGEGRLGLLSAEIIEIWDEPCVLGITEDVTEVVRLEREILDVSENERQKLGRDLHDDLCPHLIGIEVLSKVLEKKLEQKSLKEATEARKIRRLIGNAINKTRVLSKGLCPVFLIDQGFESALRELANSISEIYGIICTFEIKAKISISDNSQATHLYYIAQEAVQNAIKHGMAKKISIVLFLEGQKLNMQIIDDGLGVPKKPDKRGIGLVNMSFRAKMINASFEVRNNPGGGTTVAVSIHETSNLRSMLEHDRPH